MDYAEITVDPKFHRHLIGKGGVNSKSDFLSETLSAKLETGRNKKKNALLKF